MSTSDPTSPSYLATLTADIVSAYVSQNAVRAGDLPDVIASVHAALSSLHAPPEPEPEPLVPPVPIRKTIGSDYIISLEDGRRYKSLKRHLGRHGLTPQQYRVKWGLPSDYPMVAPDYAAQRSLLAKQSGLGRKRNDASEPTPRADDGASDQPEAEGGAAPEPISSPKPKARTRTRSRNDVPTAAADQPKADEAETSDSASEASPEPTAPSKTKPRRRPKGDAGQPALASAS